MKVLARICKELVFCHFNNCTGMYYFRGLVLRGEKNTSSALNVGSVPPSPTAPFSRSRGLFAPTTPLRLF
jgi:hypothetical protein